MFRKTCEKQAAATGNLPNRDKKYVTLTGILTDVLKPGLPAQYLYNGNLVRTSTVKEILEAAPDYVRFETRNIIYTIAYEKLPDDLRAAA